MKLVVDSRCVELCIKSLTCEVLDMDGQSSIAELILLKFFICENKNLNPIILD